VREHIFKNSTTAQIRETAIAEGMSTLYQDGIKKVLEGITTIEEVFRVTKQTEQDQ
jgi:type II secretory ATPase GspE/PulE/Tfp pilus assembly ATPase PilB-like protein